MGNTDDTKNMERQKELTALLAKASRAYYAEDAEIMSNLEYDRLYDELKELEAASGITLSGSPTVQVGYAAADALPKERHEKPMLSLDKTKSREELAEFLGDQAGLLSWKLDGLTIVLTYRDGQLFKAVTRGDGEIGEVITENAKTFVNVPLKIPFAGELILRGEALISYPDFERINAELEEKAAREGKLADLKYKNPRNLCSGSVRQLDPAVTAQRSVRFYAFSLVSADETGSMDPAISAADADAAGIPVSFSNSHEKEFEFLASLGFDVVEYVRVTRETVAAEVGRFEEKIQHFDLPSDGLVLLIDDIAYGISLGRTAKFPRNSIAFKWADEQAETELLHVEWSASRTGLINPVAVFSPVELEGTTVQRASVHNVSIVRDLKLGIGDRLLVYKANMIIPQIAENLTKSDTLQIPEACPVCGGKTEIRGEQDTKVLFCTNAACPARHVKAFAMFVSRIAMNIDGLSEMTLEKLIAAGFLSEFADIYHLAAHKEAIAQMEGFGEKSCEKLLDAIERSRQTTPERVLTAIGIPGVSVAGARVLCRAFAGDIEAIRHASAEEIASVEGFGQVLAESVTAFFADAEHAARLDRLLAELHIDKADYAANAAAAAASPIAGKTFVITGAVHHFANRDECKEFILARGGKATGSVTKKTDYLINNDAASTSSKNKKAKELGIPILTEEEFLQLAGEEA